MLEIGFDCRTPICSLNSQFYAPLENPLTSHNCFFLCITSSINFFL